MWQQVKSMGRYELKKLLGQGGMGSVYLAYDPQIGREVAVKVINLHALMHSPKEKVEITLKRFYHEAQVMGQFQHSAMVPLYDFGHEGNQPYMVMPLMTGGSLGERLYELKAKNQWLPFAEIQRLFEQIAPALHRMHAQNIVHRDLKPSNILFDGHNKPYIADFGLAKMTDRSLSFNSGAIGTPGYMSPEQVEGQTLSGKSDIYSLGCILHQMLTNEHPYHAAYSPVISYMHVSQPIPRLDALRTGLPPVWQTIINCVMAKKPSERYATVNDFVQAITQAVTPRLGIGSERLCAKDGMVQVYVPAGEFLMGSPDDDADGYDDEKPQHIVHLDGYWIDKTPVTNAMFSKFVQETGYVTKAEKEGHAWNWTGSEWKKINGANWRHPRGPQSNLKGKDYHPVVSVSWHDAKAYAEWAGRRLPTEAEWEKAAGGTDARKWPWGNYPPTNKLCNFNMKVKDTTPVGTYPVGASPYGALDMAGNVWEWCSDNFDPNYYASSPKVNPLGAKTYRIKVLRGGSWLNSARDSHARYRGAGVANVRDGDRGFRCACSPI